MPSSSLSAPPALLSTGWQRLLALSGPDPRQTYADLPEREQAQLNELACRHRVHLPNARRDNAARALRHLAELARLISALDSALIPVMPIKGLSLGLRLYGDISSRYIGDIDLLLPADCWQAADRLVQELGYRRMTPSSELPEAATPLLLRSRHDAEYFHPRLKIRLELHWRWLRNPRLLETNIGELIANASSIDLGPVTVRIPPAEIELLFLCAHGVRHRWGRLMWLNDLRHFFAKYPDLDWDRLSAANTHSLAVALRMLEALGDPIPDAAITDKLSGWHSAAVRRLAERCLVRLSMPKDNVQRSFVEEFADEWDLAASVRDFLFGYGRSRILTPTDNDVMTLRLPASLIGLYPILRPFLWIWRQR